MVKLKNSFNVFLPQKYRDFKLAMPDLSSNEAVVAELLRICCEENDVKAIKLAFERILGKPEKVIIIKRTIVRTLFPDAVKRALRPPVTHNYDESMVRNPLEDKIIVDEADAPGQLLRDMLEKVGEKGRDYAYEVVDKKETHQVAEVMIANLYAIAMRGANLGAITMLFDYLDGAVADVVRLDGEDTLLLENYADIAPYEARLDENGVWCVETEGVR